MKCIPKNDPQIACFIGGPYYYILDIPVHPTVNGLVESRDFSHIAIETELDRYFLQEHSYKSSMSRKGNSMMEAFVAISKSEMFYGYEKPFKSLEDLKQSIIEYINYDNNKHIKTKLKGLSSVQYRIQSFA